MKAFRTVEGKKAAVMDYELPVPTETQIMVKVESIAINPTDWKHVAYITVEDRGVGCDYAGVVQYDANGFKKGDRVAGFVHGGAYEKRGAYAEYLVTEPDMVYRIPKDVTFDQAAGYPIPFVTSCIALYQKLKLNRPKDNKTSDDFVLIYGGSSAVGIQAIQLAKLSGYKVIATASAKNFAMLEKLGAEKCFDYKDSDVVDKIKEYTKEKCQMCLDCISDESSLKISAQALASGGKLVLLLAAPKDIRQDIEVINVLAYTVTGQPIKYGPFDIPAQPQDREFVRTVWPLLTELLEQGKITEAPIKVIPGGLSGIQDGFDYMSGGKVSAQKLILQVDASRN